MSTHHTTPRMRPPRQQRGFTLVELMVTVGIALFLLGGLVTIVQNVRETSLNQQRLAQLQDQQRFAWTVITDAVQAGGYFSDPINYTTATFGISGNPAPRRRSRPATCSPAATSPVWLTTSPWIPSRRVSRRIKATAPSCATARTPR